MQRTLEEKTEIFETMPIRRAAMTLVIPTVISQLITVVYNLADTWFVGLSGDAAAVAAISLCLPGELPCANYAPSASPPASAILALRQ